MSNHGVRSRYNMNTSTNNNIHDMDRVGVPDNIPMLEHIGDSSPVDQDVGYTELQRDIIEKTEDNLYDRRQHDIRFDQPEGGYDPIKTNHPLKITSVQGHGDKGFDYRDFPSNVKQDHEKFDPYIQYLNSNGLIGVNKTRYNVNYVNIDSRDRNKFPYTTNDSPITLNMNPLSFNADILRIDVSDVNPENIARMTPGSKIIIRGLEEHQYTLRASVPDNFGNLIDSFVFEKGKQYMRVAANPNIDINTDVKEGYADIKVRFEGFIGDVMKRYMFDFTGFMLTTVPDINDPNNIVLKIEEDVYGDINFKVAEFVVNQFGEVIEDLTDRPYPDIITWSNTSLSFPNTPVSLPAGYYTSVELALEDLPPPSIPIPLIEYMQYIENVQNITRPIIFSFMGAPGLAFDQNYIDNMDTYQTTVRYVLTDQTVCVQTSRTGNIPLNFLNMSHRIFFTASDVEATLVGEPLTTDIPSSTNFFIQLDREYSKTQTIYAQPMGSNILTVTTYENSNSDVLVAFKHYGGLPNRSINAEYPLGPLSDAGFRFIIDVVELNNRTFALIKLSKSGFLNRNFGGDCMTIAFIESEESGSSQPNTYIAEFGRVYYKVAMIKMVSSQFPITQKAFTDGVTGGSKNNMFYWQNLDDGTIIYSIELETGNYTSDELKAELESKVRQVLRFDQEIPRNIPNFMRFEIDPNTDLVQIASFNYYKSAIEPFVSQHNFFDINANGSVENLNPENQYYVFPTGGYYTDFPGFSVSCNCYRIRILHQDHGLNKFDTIVIENSINFARIRSEYLNGSHIITQVNDANSYDIVIENVNLIDIASFIATSCGKFRIESDIIDFDNSVPAPPTTPTTTICVIDTHIDDVDSIGVGHFTADTTITGVSSDSRGGFDVIILSPNKFRIRFDELDTIGTQLGFRLVGLFTSITPYDTIITNDVLYADERINDVLSNLNSNIDVSAVDTGSIAIRNAVNLSGPPYLVITCPELENVKGLGIIKDIFYKINLRDNSRNSGADDRVIPTAYDAHANTPIFYNEPLKRLEKLTLRFLTPDGELYDFNGIDHSFTLEIITFEEIPEATSLQKK
jgi:hypothetical protein